MIPFFFIFFEVFECCLYCHDPHLQDRSQFDEMAPTIIPGCTSLIYMHTRLTKQLINDHKNPLILIRLHATIIIINIM